MAEIEASDLFDGGWYLRQHPDAVGELLSPAVHYLRTGARRRRSSPARASTPSSTCDDHPDARDSDLPPLLHHVRRTAG